MPDLPRDLRRQLEATIKTAREAAERGATDALTRLGVFDSRRPGHLDDVRNTTRLRLRAHAKSLGDGLTGADGAPLRRLIEAAAYIQWHRLLFSRFLLERDLLRDTLGVVSLADCRDEAGAGGDEWAVAATHTARMLPGVFPSDDPVEALVLAPEHAKALRDLLLKMDAAIFQADDSLGWTYQFWRAAEKKAVNESQVKIGAAELPAVTQLFTEPYMVRFLLHNTLGAWWAGKMLAERPDLARDAAEEAVLRQACALPGYAWDFLRFVKTGDVWRPAAGTFPGWPATAAAIGVLDPCCGSGHFLTEALAALTALRAAEEGLSSADAVVAVLRDNLHGLEIDGRCVQIAAFALAITAWRIGGAGIVLPTPHVAWVGSPPPLAKAEFVALANGDAELRQGLAALHDLFVDAPLLGSLIEVTGGDLVSPTRIARIDESIAALVERMRGAEPERAEGALAARGMADAAAILARRFTLQTTNVPFLGRGKQDVALAIYLAARFDTAKADLATAMLQRMRALAEPGGTLAAVTPQYWLFLGNYKALRRMILIENTIDLLAALGSRAFETISGEVVNTALVTISNIRPTKKATFSAIDANKSSDFSEKERMISSGGVSILFQEKQRGNPDSIITAEDVDFSSPISEHAASLQGLISGDNAMHRFCHWEIPGNRRETWSYLQSPPDITDFYRGRTYLLRWEQGGGIISRSSNARVQGLQGFKRRGIAVNRMAQNNVTLHDRCIFDDATNALVVEDETVLPALWAFCASDDFGAQVRKINQKISVANSVFAKLSFDLEQWNEIAQRQFPNGLPEPYSDDPTQWLFHGYPRHATAGTELQVALARLSGYRWPAETDPAMRLSPEARARIAEAATLAPPDDDGLLALVPVLGERPLADRLRAFCATAWADAWTPATESALIAAACDRATDKPPRQLTLEAWLRTHAARQHAKLFHDRPFLWWIGDGRADGFTAVAHYHRLTKTNLERLAYTVLGDWLARLGEDPRAEAARVLQAKLAQIIEGQSPHDIFVRWKPLHAQPLGWDPDLDDGVRLNIRPFIEAGVLSHAPNVHYRTDRGKDVPSAPWFPKFNGERRNDHHTTLEEKQNARDEEESRKDAARDALFARPTSNETVDPANAAAIVRPLLRQSMTSGGEAGSWLRQNESVVRPALDMTGDPKSPAVRAANSFLQWLGPRVLPPDLLRDGAGPANAISPLPLTQARPLYEALKIAASVAQTDPGSLIAIMENRPRLVPPEQRVSLGTATYRGEEVPLLLFTTRNADAERAARAADPRIQVRVVGQAAAPNSAPHTSLTVPVEEHRPGRSVAHYAGQAGSLGAYVTWPDAHTGRTVTGFLGASHVLAQMGKADPNDHIHSPGAPDADNNIAWRYGLLSNARTLVHVDDPTDANAYVNDCDIALARLHPTRNARNRVPGVDPKEGLNPIVRALSEVELRGFLGEVHLIGRTTPFSRGTFLGSAIKQFAVQMPDGREYVFGNVAAVQSVDSSGPFSRPGDSGGIVYGFQDGACVALGFVIGAAERITYISPAARCLATMGVALLGE